MPTLFTSFSGVLGYRFNHTFCLAVRKPRHIDAATIQGALEALINRHGLLRARFRPDSEAACGWRQFISTDTAGSYRFRSWQDVSVEQVKPVLEQARLGLDIENGPILAADLVSVSSSEQYLMMVAHHLVVDLVSWNNILADLESYLATREFSAPAPYPFSAWAATQKQHAIAHLPPATALPIAIPPADYEYWGMGAHRVNLIRDTTSATITLSPQDTATLLTTCNKRYGAEPMDMLCSALSHSFSYVFRDRPAPAIFRYSHGRETIASADPSGTVGWFTTLTPMHVAMNKRDDSISLLKRTIDARRKFPLNGLGFFASRYYHPDGPAQLSAFDKMEVTVNYLGVADSQTRGGKDDSFFDVSGAIENGLGADGQEVKGFSLFSISADVVGGKLGVRCVWNAKMDRQDDIRKWFYEYGNALRDVAYQSRKSDKALAVPGPSVVRRNLKVSAGRIKRHRSSRGAAGSGVIGYFWFWFLLS